MKLLIPLLFSCALAAPSRKLFFHTQEDQATFSTWLDETSKEAGKAIQEVREIVEDELRTDHRVPSVEREFRNVKKTVGNVYDATLPKVQRLSRNARKFAKKQKLIASNEVRDFRRTRNANNLKKQARAVALHTVKGSVRVQRIAKKTSNRVKAVVQPEIEKKLKEKDSYRDHLNVLKTLGR